MRQVNLWREAKTKERISGILESARWYRYDIFNEVYIPDADELEREFIGYINKKGRLVKIARSWEDLAKVVISAVLEIEADTETHWWI